MTSEDQSAGSGAASPLPPNRPGPGGRRRSFRPPRRPRRGPGGGAPQTAHAHPAEQREIQEELPAAEIANTREPGPATFADEPAELAERPVPAETYSAPSEGPSRRIEAGPPIREAIEQLQRINRDL